MYIEFIVIYVLLVILIALAVVNLILILKNKNGNVAEKDSFSYTNMNTAKTNISEKKNQAPAPIQNNSVVFCAKCAYQYSANEKFCPNCGQARK